MKTCKKFLSFLMTIVILAVAGVPVTAENATNENLFEDLKTSYLRQISGNARVAAEPVTEQILDQELVAISKDYRTGADEITTVCSVIDKAAFLRATNHSISTEDYTYANVSMRTYWTVRDTSDGIGEVALTKVTGSTSGYNSGFSGVEAYVEATQMDWKGYNDQLYRGTVGMNYSKNFSPIYMENSSGGIAKLYHHTTFKFKRTAAGSQYELYLEADYEI